MQIRNQMAPHQHPRFLCLCSKFAQFTHPHHMEGSSWPGQLLTHHTVTRNHLKDHLANRATSCRPPSSSNDLPLDPSLYTASPSASLNPSSSALIPFNSHPLVMHVMISSIIFYLFEQVPCKLSTGISNSVLS